MAQIRVLIADDHAMFREGIRQVLDREKEIDSIEEAGDIRQAERLTMKLKPDVLLLDSSVLVDLQSLRKILDRSPASRILVLTEGPTGEGSLRYIRAGARGTISKTESGAALAKAVRAVAAGEIWVGRREMARVIQDLAALAAASEGPNGSPASALTKRERRIAELVAEGCSNGEIAHRLRLSEKTVKNHLTRVFQKLGCRSRTRLVSLLIRFPSPGPGAGGAALEPTP